MKRIGLGIAGFLIAGLILWGLLSWRDRQMLKQLRAEMGIARRDSVITELGHEVLRTDTVRLRDVVTHREVVSSPTTTKADVARSCQQVILSCDARIRASDVLADSLRAQVEAVRKLKAKSPPRFAAFAEGGYDFVHREPVVRAGGEMRLFGPLSLVVAGESSFGLEKSRQRAVVSARFTFR